MKYILFFLLLFSAHSYAEVFKCVVNGKTLYTQIGCPVNSQKPLNLKETTENGSGYSVHFGYLHIDPKTHKPELTQETAIIAKGTDQNWGLLVFAGSKSERFSINTEITGNCEWNGKSALKYGPYNTQWMYYWPLQPGHAEKECKGKILVFINGAMIKTVDYEIK